MKYLIYIGLCILPILSYTQSNSNADLLEIGFNASIIEETTESAPNCDIVFFFTLNDSTDLSKIILIIESTDTAFQFQEEFILDNSPLNTNSDSSYVQDQYYEFFFNSLLPYDFEPFYKTVSITGTEGQLISIF